MKANYSWAAAGAALNFGASPLGEFYVGSPSRKSAARQNWGCSGGCEQFEYLAENTGSNCDGPNISCNALPPLDVVRLHPDYKESKRVDGRGNRFRYRAKVDDAKGSKVDRRAWDVFLVRGR